MPKNFKQLGNACLAYSLALVEQLVRADPAPADPATWHRKVVGDYAIWHKHGIGEPGGYWKQIIFKPEDYASSDDEDVQLVGKSLVAAEHSDPRKVARLVADGAIMDHLAAVEFCISPTAEATIPALADADLRNLLGGALKLMKHGAPVAIVRRDAVEAVAAADAGTAYAALSCYQPKCTSLHTVTLRKNGKGELEVHDSLSEEYTNWTVVDREHLKSDVSVAFESGADTLIYTGCAVLFTKVVTQQ